jgi:hypothetical protein
MKIVLSKVLLLHLSQGAKKTTKASKCVFLIFVLGISRKRSNNICNYMATFTLTYESRPAHFEVTTAVTSFTIRQKSLYRELLWGLSLSSSSTSSSRLNRPCIRTGKRTFVYFFEHKFARWNCCDMQIFESTTLCIGDNEHNYSRGITLHRVQEMSQNFLLSELSTKTACLFSCR